MEPNGHKISIEELGNMTPEQIQALPPEVRQELATRAQMTGLNDANFSIQATMKKKVLGVL